MRLAITYGILDPSLKRIKSLHCCRSNLSKKNYYRVADKLYYHVELKF